MHDTLILHIVCHCTTQFNMIVLSNYINIYFFFLFLIVYLIIYFIYITALFSYNYLVNLENNKAIKMETTPGFQSTNFQYFYWLWDLAVIKSRLYFENLLDMHESDIGRVMKMRQLNATSCTPAKGWKEAIFSLCKQITKLQPFLRNKYRHINTFAN